MGGERQQHQRIILVGVVAWIPVRANEPLSISGSAGRVADGVGPCGVQQAVEHGHANGGFGALVRQAAGAQARTP